MATTTGMAMHGLSDDENGDLQPLAEVKRGNRGYYGGDFRQGGTCNGGDD